MSRHPGGLAGLEVELSSSVKQTVSLLRVWLHLNLRGIEPTQTNSLRYKANATQRVLREQLSDGRI